MWKKRINYYYSAGEMKKEGANFTFNFLSGTFMQEIFTNNPDKFIEIVKITTAFFDNQRQLYGIIINYNADTFIKPDMVMNIDFFNYLDRNHFVTFVQDYYLILGGKNLNNRIESNKIMTNIESKKTESKKP